MLFLFMRSHSSVQAVICSFQVSLWKLLGRFPLDKMALGGCKSDTHSSAFHVTRDLGEAALSLKTISKGNPQCHLKSS